MSRIAGIISAKDQTYLKHMTGRMLAMLPGKKHKLAAGNGVCLGWSGNTDCAIHKENGCITVLDGQIFNIKEIKNLLCEHGSDNPAEILHALYQKCGFAEALKRINGDFAIAVYDQKEKITSIMFVIVDETKATTDGIMSDTNFLKNYAKNKKSNMGQIVETGKKKKEIKYLNKNPHEDPRIPEWHDTGEEHLFDEFGNYIGD